MLWQFFPSPTNLLKSSSLHSAWRNGPLVSDAQGESSLLVLLFYQSVSKGEAMKMASTFWRRCWESRVGRSTNPKEIFLKSLASWARHSTLEAFGNEPAHDEILILLLTWTEVHSENNYVSRSSWVLFYSRTHFFFRASP